ncbi:hypothetical protein ACJX0J_025845, partial [Zea mays]
RTKAVRLPINTKLWKEHHLIFDQSQPKEYHISMTKKIIQMVEMASGHKPHYPDLYEVIFHFSSC